MGILLVIRLNSSLSSISFLLSSVKSILELEHYTLIPYGAHSRAKTLVNWTNAPLLAAYAPC